MISKKLQDELRAVVKNQFSYSESVLPKRVKIAEAYMNPHIQTFKGVEWTSASKQTQEVVEGTVAWSLDWFDHGQTVVDKHGVEHKAIPLYSE